MIGVCICTRFAVVTIRENNRRAKDEYKNEHCMLLPTWISAMALFGECRWRESVAASLTDFYNQKRTGSLDAQQAAPRVICVVSAARELFRVYPRQPDVADARYELLQIVAAVGRTEAVSFSGKCDSIRGQDKSFLIGRWP